MPQLPNSEDKLLKRKLFKTQCIFWKFRNEVRQVST